MGITSSVKSFLAAAFAAFQLNPTAFTPEGFGRSVTRELQSGPPDSTRNTSQAKYRRRHGIPHGVSGAKLARKAMAGTVGNHGMVH